MPFARAPNGTRIAYQVRGSLPRTLIFIHAWGESGSYFDEAIDNLDLTSARAITVDLRVDPGYLCEEAPRPLAHKELVFCDQYSQSGVA